MVGDYLSTFNHHLSTKRFATWGQSIGCSFSDTLVHSIRHSCTDSQHLKKKSKQSLQVHSYWYYFPRSHLNCSFGFGFVQHDGAHLHRLPDCEEHPLGPHILQVTGRVKLLNHLSPRVCKRQLQIHNTCVRHQVQFKCHSIHSNGPDQYRTKASDYYVYLDAPFPCNLEELLKGNDPTCVDICHSCTHHWGKKMNEGMRGSHILYANEFRGCYKL